VVMAIPAYMWLKDDGGADIKGSVDVHNRQEQTADGPRKWDQVRVKGCGKSAPRDWQQFVAW